MAWNLSQLIKHRVSIEVIIRQQLMAQIKSQYTGPNLQESAMTEKRLLNMTTSPLDRSVMAKLIVSRLDSSSLRIRLVNIATITARFPQTEKTITTAKEKARKAFSTPLLPTKIVSVTQLLFTEYVELGIIVFILSLHFIPAHWGLCTVVSLRSISL